MGPIGVVQFFLHVLISSLGHEQLAVNCKLHNSTQLTVDSIVSTIIKQEYDGSSIVE